MTAYSRLRLSVATAFTSIRTERRSAIISAAFNEDQLSILSGGDTYSAALAGTVIATRAVLGTAAVTLLSAAASHGGIGSSNDQDIYRIFEIDDGLVARVLRA